MPNRCANCGSFDGRGRELPLPADWLSYLQTERGVADPIGTLKLPLCTDCTADFEAREEDDSVPTELLDAIETNRLIDDH